MYIDLTLFCKLKTNKVSNWKCIYEVVVPPGRKTSTPCLNIICNCHVHCNFDLKQSLNDVWRSLNVTKSKDIMLMFQVMNKKKKELALPSFRPKQNTLWSFVWCRTLSNTTYAPNRPGSHCCLL